MSEGTQPDTSPTARAPDERQYAFGPFRVDTASRHLFRENVRVPLTDKAFETLVWLVRKQGEVVTKDELIREIWPDTFVSEDSLTQNISALRRTLEDDPAQPRFIATVARRGYRFVAPVTAISDVTRSLDAAQPQPEIAPVPVEVRPVRGRPWISKSRWMAVGAIAGLAAGAGLVLTVATGPSDEAVVSERLRFTLEVPAGVTLASSGSLSPDGEHVAFVARDDRSGQTQLWIQTLSTATVRAVPGSEGALHPFWSPDSRSIAFFGANRLRRATLAGGLPTIICETIQPRPPGGSWNTRDEIIFADRTSLYVVSARGGRARKVLSPSAAHGDLSLEWPQFLPGGDEVIYEVKSANPSLNGIYAASLAGNDRTKLLEVSGQQVAYARGSLIYVEQRQLKTRSFNAATRRLTGEPTIIVDDVSQAAAVSASPNGIVTFGGGAAEIVTLFDRDGRSLGTLTNAPAAFRNLSLSPDQQILLGDGIGPGGRSVWLVDVTRNVPTLLTAGTYPVWTPDGKGVVFNAARSPGGDVGMYLKAIDRPGEELLLLSPTVPVINDFPRTSRSVVYVPRGQTTQQDIWLLPLDEPKTPTLLLAGVAKEIQAQVSPDGRWIAYASDEEDGVFQVYVQAFPTLGSKQRVSASGGAQPQWRADGGELFYLSSDQTLMSVSVTSGAQLRLGTAQSLFRTQLLGPMTDYRNQYTVFADGGRFLVSLAPATLSLEPITVIANWQAISSQANR